MVVKNKYTFISLVLLGALAFQSCKENKISEKTEPSPATNVKEQYTTPGLDKSPMDMSYYPVDYPKLKMSGNIEEPLVARIIYSRPKKDGRIIFGNVVKYGLRWRLGANEATEIEFFKPVNIQGQAVNPGRYIIYCIPSPDKWAIILNSDLFTWGLKIDSTKDVKKFDVPVSRLDTPLEVFSMEFAKARKGMQLSMGWDSVKAVLPIDYH